MLLCMLQNLFLLFWSYRNITHDCSRSSLYVRFVSFYKCTHCKTCVKRARTNMLNVESPIVLLDNSNATVRHVTPLLFSLQSGFVLEKSWTPTPSCIWYFMVTEASPGKFIFCLMDPSLNLTSSTKYLLTLKISAM